MIRTSRIKCFSFIASARCLVILLIAMSLSFDGTPGWTDEPAFDLADGASQFTCRERVGHFDINGM
ncbi:MAG: hypothetical protein KDA92_10120 [Planctomycetales bacterium]|nr:hypothetical protein [Planctomycetales bacterium]MCA9166347.1 hypothetical protein [Planctomycetales bacterium]